METKQILIQKKQELAGLETKLQQLPKGGSGGIIGLVITVLGVIIFIAGSGNLEGMVAFVIGIIWWITGSISKSNKRNAINDISSKILKLKNEIIEIETR